MSRALLLALAAYLTGCLVPGSSETSHLWSLPETSQGDANVRVFLPAELRTPRVVAADAGGAALPRDLDRWETPLSSGLARHLAAGLRGLGLREAIVRVEALRVDTAGGFHGSFRAQLRLDRPPGTPDLELATAGSFTGETDVGERGLGRAVGAYAAAAAAMSAEIGAAIREAKGEVAKPVPAVTVPGK